MFKLERRKQNEQITSLATSNRKVRMSALSTLKKQKRKLSIIATVVLTCGLTIFITQNVTAATSPWTQTDWSGGAASGTVTSTVTTYEATSNVDPTTTSGQFSLSETSGWSGTYSNWAKRQTVTLTNTGDAQTNYQVKLDVTYDSDMQADFDDLRFTNSSGTALDYWIKEYTASTDAEVWVEIDSLAGSGDTDIHMYYGNSGASDASDGEATFLLFDDFDDGTIDTSKWVEVDQVPPGEIYESGGELIFSRTTNDTWNKTVYSHSDYTFARSDLSFEMDYTWVSNNSGWDALMMGWHDNTAGVSYTNLVYAYYNNGCNCSSTSVTQAIYEDGSSRGNATGHTWDQNQDTQVRIRMRESGGAYYEYSTDGGDTFSTAYTSSYSTESNLRPGWAFYTGIHHYDNARVRKWMATEPSTAFGSEASKYQSSGTLTSNILDAEFAADWETVSFTTSGSGTVTVKIRSDSNSDMSGATAWGSCSGVTSGSTGSDDSCVSDTDQYFQYQITLEPSSASTPIFEEFSIEFSASDQVAPTTNASSVAITGVSDGDWANSEPTITWTAGADNVGGNGLLGYCISLDEGSIGVSSSLDPASSGGELGGLDDGVTQAYCPFIVTGTSVDLSSISGLSLTSNSQYYFSIKAVDQAGNIFTGATGTYQDLVSFKYDDVAPTNVTFISTPSSSFGSVNDMFFTWPTSGGSAATDSHSGVIGWQYSIGDTVSWTGPDTEATLGIDYIEDDSSTAEHYLTEGDDGADVAVGNNTIYFRTVDQAGNYSTPVSGGINYGGAAPTFGGGDQVTVTPSTNTSNSFGLSWPAATAGSGSIESYYYIVNSTPPSTLSTLQGNSSLYVPTTSTSVATGTLVGSVKGSNTVYVVAVDDSDNYSPSNYISGAYTLNSSNPDPVDDLAVSDTSIKSEEIWRAALAWSAPTYKGNGNLTYKIQRSTDNSNWTDVATTTGLSYTDTVDTSQLYYYRVGVYDTSDDSTNNPTYATSVSVTPKGTFDEPPDLSSGPTVSAITTKRATISWSTSRTADSKIQFGTSSGDYFDEEPSKSDHVTSHEILLTNLNPGTKYYYKAKWTDEDGNTGISDELTFKTDPAPTITAPTVKQQGINSVTLEYTTKNASKVKIYYGKSTTFGGILETSTSISETTYTTEITGLEDGTQYYYKINTFDAENEEYEGNNLTFETLPRPRISNVRIQQVRGTAQPTALITWTTNTEVSSIVSYYPDGNPSAIRDEVNVALTEGEHRMIIRGLLPQTRYILQVSGRDFAGNEAISDQQTVTTATDTRPPLISNLKIEGTNIPSINTTSSQPKSQLVITWDTDEAATSQVEYGEGTGSTYSQRTQEDTNFTFNHLVVVSGLTPAKVYHLRAISSDDAGNKIESIDVVTITPKATDNALDLVISNLQEAFGFIGGLQQ